MSMLTGKKARKEYLVCSCLLLGQSTSYCSTSSKKTRKVYDGVSEGCARVSLMLRKCLSLDLGQSWGSAETCLAYRTPWVKSPALHKSRGVAPVCHHRLRRIICSRSCFTGSRVLCCLKGKGRGGEGRGEEGKGRGGKGEGREGKEGEEREGKGIGEEHNRRAFFFTNTSTGNIVYFKIISTRDEGYIQVVERIL